MAEALIIVRWLHFASAMLVFGTGAFQLYAFAGGGIAAGGQGRHELDQTLRRHITIAAMVALITALAMVPCMTAQMTGSAAAVFDPALAHTVLFATAFGRVWCWHTGFAAALVLLSALPPSRWRDTAVTGAALLLLASLGWVGHATMDRGIAPEVNQMVHLVAAGLWLGGLVPLGILLRRALVADGDAHARLARAALPHFSQIGFVAVALVVLTGIVNGIFLVGSINALGGTSYGRLLLVKITLFLAMVGLALVNRFRLVPRVSAGAAASLRTLLWSVGAEQGLGLAILAIVAVLGTWPPSIVMR